MGQLKLKSQHRVLCGDATSAEAVERLMDGHEAALCFTSPPYNAGPNSLGGNKNRVDSKYLHDDDDKPQDEYRQFLEQFTAIALKVCRTVAVNLQSLAGNKVVVLEWIYTFRMHFVDRMVWYKGGGQPAIAANVMNSRFEDVWILSPEKNPIAVEKLGRRCFAMELDGVYCDVAIKRYEDLILQEKRRCCMGKLNLKSEHRLLCGDSTIADDVKLLMDGDKADLVFSDPPYDVAYQGGTEDGALQERKRCWICVRCS